MTLTLAESAYIAMREHVEQVYPEEGCGLMLGTFAEAEVTVVYESVPVENVWPVPAERVHRYEISPETFVRIDRYARNKHLDVVGVYHSHPDHPDTVSEFDRATAWPDLSYLVFSVWNRRAISCSSYRLNEKSKKLELEIQNFENNQKMQPHSCKFR